jgi:hypothetical protein
VSRPSASLRTAIIAALVSLSAFSACGEDSPDEEAAAGQTAGSGRGGSSASGGKSGRGGSADAGASNAGAPTGEAGADAGGSSASDGGSAGDTGNTSQGGAAAGSGGFQVPGPAPGGGSVYAVECSGETAMCGTEHAHCLGLNLPEGETGFACSNHCETVADCSDEPSGAEAEPGCIPFTMEQRCMLVCYEQGSEYSCPDGMSCYVYPNATIGYCLWGL